MTQTKEHGKVLIENWVEERACEAYDNECYGPEINRSGHVGIISTKEPEEMESLTTTVRDTYRPPSRPNIRQKGSRLSVREAAVYDQISKEVEEERQPPKITPDYKSTMNKDYYMEFSSEWPEPQFHHNLLHELPVSYWTDGVSKGVEGVTQIRCDGSPFKKNTAFSTPTEFYMDQPRPYEESHLAAEPISKYG